MTELRQREPRQTDEQHLKDVRCLSCVVCLSNVGVEAAHIRYTAPGKFNPGGGQKPHDYYVVPLCHQCHWEQTNSGERNWWRDKGINPLPIAAQLYERRGNMSAMLGLIRMLHQRYESTLEIPF